VRNALRRVVDTGKVRVRVNAEDLETVRASREELATLIDGIENLEIISDRRVGAGGAVVETEGGTIDARIETQLSEIATLLNELTDEAA
jgi:flagellar assembly protein FliH